MSAAIPTVSRDAYLSRQPSLARCPGCNWMVRKSSLEAPSGVCPSCELREIQQAIAHGRRLAAQGMARAAAAHPEERAKVEAAIRQLAATGAPFSANEVRDLTGGIRGPVVGAAFQAAAKAGVIHKVGYEPSTEPGTHGHPVATWVGVVGAEVAA